MSEQELSPLPLDIYRVSDPERLLTLGRQYPSGVAYGFTYPQYEIFRDRGEALDLAAYSNIRLDPTIDGVVEPTLDAQFVSGEYFPILGVRPSVGRLFDENDDRMPMAHMLAVQTEALTRPHTRARARSRERGHRA